MNEEYARLDIVVIVVGAAPSCDAHDGTVSAGGAGGGGGTLVRGGVADEECRRRPRAPGGMSVFGDFQRVWVQRFPDSALPAAWEEDVRANLVKHKQKVS